MADKFNQSLCVGIKTSAVDHWKNNVNTWQIPTQNL